MTFLVDENLALSFLQPSIEKGALITVDDNGIRIKELPIG